MAKNTFQGTSAADTLTGTRAAEIFIGGKGGDTLIGRGGADEFEAGEGNDEIVIRDLTFQSIDGGNGTDTLALARFGLFLDLTDPTVQEKIKGIERIDLSGSGNNGLTLDQFAVLNETRAGGNGVHRFTVEGNSGDTVTFTEPQWAKVGIFTHPSGTYDRYVFGSAEVRIEQGVTVNIPEPSSALVIDLTALSAAQGFIIQGAYGQGVGGSVSGAGDVNGDGFDDLIVGAPGGAIDEGYSYIAGEAYVMFGKASGFGATVNTDGFDRQVIDLTTLSPADGFIIQGGYDYAGNSVSSAGDINGDGFDDLIVGAPIGDGGGRYAGESYVVFGKPSGFGATANSGSFDQHVIKLAELSAADGFIIQGDTDEDFAGGVSDAGDVNGDGFGDLMVGAGGGDDGGNDAGEAYVVFGKVSGFGTAVNTGGFDRQVIDLTTLSAADGFIIQGDTAGDSAGHSASGAGDVNGDGFADLIVGAYRAVDGGYSSGEAYVVFGKASGFGATVNTGGFDRQVIDVTTLTAADGFIMQGGGFAGISVSDAGDVNGDGFADLIVGAHANSDRGPNAGEAYVVFGKASSFGTTVNDSGFDRQVIDLTMLSGADGFVIQGGTAQEAVGSSVSAAGDVNGDGFDDLIVGAPGGYDATGEAYVLFGGAFGASDEPVTTTGSAAAEIFIGGLGDDSLTGGGAADVFHAGAGDDVITVADFLFGLADGGTGNDTLVLLGSGASFDFTAFADNKTQSIEAIDVSGSGDNTLTLGLTDVLNMPDGRNFDFSGVASVPQSMVIDGNAGDTLELEGDTRGVWVQTASDVDLDGSAGGAYDFWVFDAGATEFAALAVFSTVDVMLT